MVHNYGGVWFIRTIISIVFVVIIIVIIMIHRRETINEQKVVVRFIRRLVMTSSDAITLKIFCLSLLPFVVTMMMSVVMVMAMKIIVVMVIMVMAATSSP